MDSIATILGKPIAANSYLQARRRTLRVLRDRRHRWTSRQNHDGAQGIDVRLSVLNRHAAKSEEKHEAANGVKRHSSTVHKPN